MEHIEFENVNIPVAVAAKALNVDCQTIRLLLQNKMVDWGIAYKRGKSKNYSYNIYVRLREKNKLKCAMRRKEKKGFI